MGTQPKADGIVAPANDNLKTRKGFDRVNNITLKVYPNPFNESTTFLLPEELDLSKSFITIHNILGEEVVHISTLSEQQLQIQKGNLTNGIYFLQVFSEGNLVSTLKIILQ